MQVKKEDVLLYVIKDRHWLGEETLCDQVEKALKGGATFVQLREKHLDEETLRVQAKEIQALCSAYGVPFILNDHVELAAELGADGVHVGQQDMAAGTVRTLLGPDQILGVSVKTVEQAKNAERCGADYLGVGAVFPTGSKEDASEVSHEIVAEICKAVSIPVVAVGGITRENLGKLSGRGLSGIAVISAVFGADDIEEAARLLAAETKEMVGREWK